LQLLLLPSSDEERDRTSKIWDYCTNLPAPRADRWTQLEEFFESMVAEKPKAGKGDQTKSPVSPADAGKLRSFMDPTTTGNRTSLKWGDMHKAGTEASDDNSGGEENAGQGKLSRSTSSREHARGEPPDHPDTPQWERSANFRAAIRAAWPGVGGIQHRLDRYLPMDYEDMEWAAPHNTSKNYAKNHARWEQIEQEKAQFREAHDLSDICLPNHAPQNWRTGDPLPREWERMRRNEATDEDLLWTQGTPKVYTKQEKANYDAYLQRQSQGKSES